ncbi:hypothetical protein LWC34_26430 [Kibdelosporangium philippinense]|uniref:DUF4878 domain-containing protein n=1 Tax=Kibdelosporangium philippinense TaxID=211113 RepID=A0ABS8ZEV2_9PSEU|nr:hypothetical protein [Kibdelosporangium philippinense]MCE7006344.1 hypothetical protein [Kibdelosporangium philippinense]
MTYPPQQPPPGQYPYGPQQPPYGPPGWPPPPPPKNKTGLVVALVAAAVLLIGGVVTVVLLTTGDSSNTTSRDLPAAQTTTSKPTKKPGGTVENKAELEAAVKPVAQQYADAVIRQDSAAAQALTCKKVDPGVMYENLAGEAEPVVGKVTIYSSTRITVDMGLKGVPEARGVPLPFVNQNGTWCVEV